MTDPAIVAAMEACASPLGTDVDFAVLIWLAVRRRTGRYPSTIALREFLRRAGMRVDNKALRARLARYDARAKARLERTFTTRPIVEIPSRGWFTIDGDGLPADPVLYALYDGSELVYVGETQAGYLRLTRSHAVLRSIPLDKRTVKLRRAPADRNARMLQEARLIARLRPRLNAPGAYQALASRPPELVA